MKLKPLILNYIAYRKSIGEKFRTNGDYLKALCRSLGDDIDIKDISTEMVAEFLYGNSPVTSAWFIKHTALFGFYEYAISRGFIDCSPLPINLPKRPPAFVPYIYNRAELRQLFKTALIYQKNRSHVEPYMVSKLLLNLLVLIALNMWSGVDRFVKFHLKRPRALLLPILKKTK